MLIGVARMKQKKPTTSITAPSWLIAKIDLIADRMGKSRSEVGVELWLDALAKRDEQSRSAPHTEASEARVS
jgi:hypothetical protein